MPRHAHARRGRETERRPGRRPLANPAGPKAAGAHPGGARAAKPRTRREKGPSASLRDDSDNGTCPAMPGAAGPENGAARDRAAIP